MLLQTATCHVNQKVRSPGCMLAMQRNRLHTGMALVFAASIVSMLEIRARDQARVTDQIVMLPLRSFPLTYQLLQQRHDPAADHVLVTEKVRSSAQCVQDSPSPGV